MYCTYVYRSNHWLLVGRSSGIRQGEQNMIDAPFLRRRANEKTYMYNHICIEIYTQMQNTYLPACLCGIVFYISLSCCAKTKKIKVMQ